ncbi:MAG: PaaI family thioesterase [Myxococcales bacterium]|nr:PaaI family thioesterase [Myxococcales bacterium]
MTAPPASSLLARIAEAKQRGDLGSLLAMIPYAAFLGLSTEVVSGELITTMHPGEHLIGNPMLPALHGGTLGALVESAAIFELVVRAQSALLPKTITLTIDYLRSAALCATHACGVVTRHGRRVANVRVEAWQEDRRAPVVTAHAVFLVTSSGAASAE